MISQRKNGREWWEDDPLAAFGSFDLDASFGETKSAIFRNADGQAVWKINSDSHDRPDVSRLATLAKRAVERLFSVVNIEGGARPAELVAHFLAEAEGVRGYFVDEMRRSPEHFRFQAEGSGREIPQTEAIESFEDESAGAMLLMVAKATEVTRHQRPDNGADALFVAMLCSACLREVDYALRAIDWECDDSTRHTISAIECMRLADNICESDDERERVVSDWGRRARRKALESDPKQQQKLQVKECWQEWRTDKRRYASKAAFARDMLDKFPDLKSSKVIEDWCRHWQRSEPNA